MRATLTMLALVAGGCGSQVGTENGGFCEVVDTEAVTDPAATPDGFGESVQAMLDRVLGTFEGTLTHPGGTSAVTLTVAKNGDPVIERVRWKEPTSGIEIGGDCKDAVRIPVAVTLSAPPELDETFDTTVFVLTDGEGGLYWNTELANVKGTATPASFSVDEMEQVDFNVQASAVTGGWDGGVGFVGTSPPSGRGKDASVSATFDDWGTFEVRRPAE